MASIVSNQTVLVDVQCPPAVMVVIATIVLVNHDELRTAAQARAGGADRVEMVLYELEAAPELVEPTGRTEGRP